MNRNIKQAYVAAAANLAGHASNVTGAEWAITTEQAGDGMAHKVTIRNDTITDHGGKTITLTGYGANGEAVSETLAAPGASATVTSTKYYKGLTSAVPSATIDEDTFDIGWTEAAQTPWFDLNPELRQFNLSVAVLAGGTINYDVQHTYDMDHPDDLAISHSGITGKTASADGQYLSPIAGVRVKVNSHTNGTFTFFALQGERA